MSDDSQSRRNLVFQSEEERKAVQRKILAEKFGLKIESDEEDIAVTITPETTGDHVATSESLIQTQRTDISQVTPSRLPTFDEMFSEKSTDVSLKQQDTATTPSTCEWSPLKMMNVEYEDAVLNVTRKDLAPVGRYIPKRDGVFFYDNLQSSTDDLSETEGDLRVTPITVYNSVANDYNGRRIAVNSHLITYAVKNHIRVLSRFTASKELLKGHNDEVIDLEFARFDERYSTLNNDIFVLVSSGKEGCVFVWFLEVDNENAFHCVGHLRFDHPQREEGSFFRRIAFHGDEKYCKIAVADAKTPKIFVIITCNITKRLQNEPAAFTAVHEEEEPIVCLQERISSSETSHMNDLIFKDADHLLSAGMDGILYLWCLSTRTLLLKYAHSTVLEPISCISLLRSSFVHDMIVVIRSSGHHIELFELRTPDSEWNDWSFVLSHKKLLWKMLRMTMFRASKQVIALHFSCEEKIYADFISRFQVRYPILSFCVTRCGRKIRYVNEDESWEGSEINLIEEIGIWCVQPKSIQYLHLYADKCRPSSKSLETEILDQSFSLSPHGTEEAAISPNQTDIETFESSKEASQSAWNTLHSSEADKETNAGLDERSNVNVDPLNTFKSKSDNTATAAFPRRKSTSSGIRILSKKEAAASQFGNTKQSHPVTILKKPSTVSQIRKETGSSNRADVYNAASQQPSQVSIETSGINQTASSDPGFQRNNTSSDAFHKFKQQVLEEVELSSRRSFEAIAQQLENERVQREKLEREKLEKLLGAVSDTVNHRLEQFVNSALEKEIEQTVVPRLSETVAETFQKWTRSDNVEQLLSQLLEAQFGNTLDSVVRKSCEELFESRLVPAFEAACREMLNQVDSAVVEGFQRQVEFLLKRDFFDPISGMQEKISSILENLKVQSAESKEFSSYNTRDETQTTLVSKEVLQTQMSELLGQENYEGAFLLALGASNLDIVEWLCEKLDCHALFQADEPPLSQVTLLSLIQQLGFDLQRQTELKIEWLKEAVMLLEPLDEMIQDYLPDILSMLVQNLQNLLENGIRNSQQSLSTHLQRNIKVLLHICRSFEKNS
ncbi:Enhancer of mRNA-decapping protein 4 [Galdieria sulphuraria]|nr:Enhancer of mRNA-decapping protein 4 [Galdieria sulphuraria]